MGCILSLLTSKVNETCDVELLSYSNYITKLQRAANTRIPGCCQSSIRLLLKCANLLKFANVRLPTSNRSESEPFLQRALETQDEQNDPFIPGTTQRTALSRGFAPSSKPQNTLTGKLFQITVLGAFHLGSVV